MKTRRCPLCDLNWPNVDKYVHCPQCLQHTIEKNLTPNAIMSDTEANSLVAHRLFEQFLENETETERAERQLKYQRECDEAAERRARALNTSFHSVIKGAGFTPEERQAIEQVEAQLPMAHLNRPPD